MLYGNKGVIDMEHRKEAALSFLSQDPLLHADMLSAIQRGTADILKAGPDGVLLLETGGNVFMLSARDEEAGKRLIAQCGGDREVVLHQLFLLPMGDTLGLTSHNVCFQAVYDRKTPVEYHCPYPIAPLTKEDLPTVLEHYQLIRDPEILLEHITAGHMWGVRKDGVLMGFIGIHSEGSMGLLEVFPEYRRMGLAFALEGFLINRHLEKGLIPYCQIFEDNAASLALQKKLGLSFAEGRVTWVFRPHTD